MATDPWLIGAAWAQAAGTIIVAAVAVGQDALRRRWCRPVLDLDVHMGPPDCHKTTFQGILSQSQSAPANSPGIPGGHSTFSPPFTGFSGIPTNAVRVTAVPPLNIRNVEGYMLRISVRNKGRGGATKVEVYARELRFRDVNGNFVIQSSFIPMNLLWSNLGEVYYPYLAPGMTKHCDLGHIIEPLSRTGLIGEELPGADPTKVLLSLDMVVKPHQGGHLLRPGEYRLVVTIAAANALPRDVTLVLNVEGQWRDAESEMLSEGVGIRKEK